LDWARKRFRWIHSRRLDRLQSGVVLPTARTLYLAGSLVCAAAILLALIVALFFQLSSWRGASQQRVPDAIAAPAPAPGLDAIARRLAGPSGLRFVADTGLGPTIEAGQVLGAFDADSDSGLAPPPQDFELLGGRDAELFERAYDPRSGRSGLAATGALAAVWKGAPPAAGRSFLVRVRARDSSGNVSAPADVAVTLRPGAAAAPAPAGTEVTDLGGDAALSRIAHALAGRVAARGTPDYFDAYKYALAQPQRCDAEGQAGFLDHYRAAAVRFRERLTGDNIGSFYAGVCAAWDEARAASARVAADAEAERRRVIAANAHARLEAESRNAQSRLLRNAALGFGFSALIAFMMIALFLAFMAIEGHSAAVRNAIELLAAERETRDEPA
jgi:hypothetical protein